MIPTFYSESFLFSSLGVFLYKIFVFSGLLLVTYFLSVLTKVKQRTLLVILIVIELGLLFILMMIQNGVNLPTFIDVKFRNFYVGSFRNTVQYNSNLAQYNPDLLYTLKEGKGVFTGWEFSDTFQINRLGVRDDDQSLINPEIIFLGDSYTMGWGVSQEETFAQIVEQKTSMNSLNMGISSYGTAREFLLLEKIDYSSSKLMVIQFCSNDNFENNQFVKQGKLEISSKESYEKVILRNNLNLSYYPFKYFFEFVAKIPRAIIREIFLATDSEVSDEEESSKNYVENFFKIIDLIQKRFEGKILILHIEPHRISKEVFLDFEKYIKEHQYSKVFLLDTWNFIEPNDYYELDDHLKAEGHQKIGEGILQFIKEQKIIK